MEEVDNEFFFENILEDDSVNDAKAHYIVPGDESRKVDSNVKRGEVCLYMDEDLISGGDLLEAIGPLNSLTPIGSYMSQLFF